MKIRYMITMLIILIIAAGCSLNIVPEEDSVETTKNNSTKGQMTLHIPSIPSYLSEGLQKPDTDTDKKGEKEAGSKAVKNKAIGFCSNATLTINNAGGTVGEYSLFADSTSNYLEETIILAPGTGYTASIEIYNYAISDTEPVTSGTSSEFSITEGENTNVYIVALPTAPTTLAIDTPLTITGTPSDVDTNTQIVTNIGGEFWFLLNEIDYASTTIQISHDSEDSLTGYVQLALFNTNGNLIKTELSPGVYDLNGDLTLEYSFESTIGNNYYACVIPLNLSDDSSAEFTISYSQGPADDEYEDNDDSTTATPLTEGTSLSAIWMDYDYYTFTLTEEKLVAIGLSMTTVNTSMVITLYDSLNNYINNRYCFTPGDELQQMLSAGTYYVRISENSNAWGCNYNLVWNSSEPPSDDEYEDNDTSETATPLDSDTVLSAASMDYDYYTFTLTSEAIVTISCEFLHSEGDIDIELSNESGNIAGSYGVSDNETINMTLPADTYYILVYRCYGTYSTYTLSWTQ